MYVGDSPTLMTDKGLAALHNPTYTAAFKAVLSCIGIDRPPARISTGIQTGSGDRESGIVSQNLRSNSLTMIEDRQPITTHNPPRKPRNGLIESLFFSEKSTLASERRLMVFSEGEMILQADQHPSNVHIVTRGRVKISVFGRSGRERIIRMAADGDLLDYRSALTGDPHTVYAIAMETTELCAIPSTTFLELARTDIAVAFDIINKLSTDLKAAEVEAATCMQKSVGERMAETLLDLASRYGVDAKSSVILMDLTRGDLAKFIGTATETVSRVLWKFQRDEVIELIGPKIRIVDRRALVRRANGEG